MFSLVAFLSVCTFFLFHKLDIWPLPVPIVTLVSEITTLLFFVELAFYIYFRQHTKGLQWFTTPPPHSEAYVSYSPPCPCVTQPSTLATVIWLYIILPALALAIRRVFKPSSPLCHIQP